MKILAIIVILFLVGCDDPQAAQPTPTPRLEVAVIAKENPVETRHQLTVDGFKPRAVTIYYLILENGRKCEVDVVTWARTKVGDKSNCE